MPKAAKDQKEVYRLWWEYLKRSPTYARYCKTNIISRIESEDSYDPPSIAIISEIWDFFGNVHKENFDNWWANIKWPDNPKAVVLLEDAIELRKNIYAQRYDRFLREENRHPLITDFPKLLHYKHDKQYLFLRISIEWDIDTINKQVAEIISERRKDEEVKERIRLRRGIYFRPTGKILLTELKRYLNVYDLWNDKMKRKEIIKIAYKDLAKPSEESYLRTYHQELKKAICIIKNVERREFPGKY
jgi:hypothetical protein